MAKDNVQTPIAHVLHAIDDAHKEGQELSKGELHRELKDKTDLLWVHFFQVPDYTTLGLLARRFGLHPLTVEDLQTEQRTKRELHRQYLYIVVKAMSVVGEDDPELAEQFSLVLGQKFVLSFQESNDDLALFQQAKQRIGRWRDEVDVTGSDFIAYTLLDILVDDYIPLLDRFDDRLDALEVKVLDGGSDDLAREISKLKQQLIFFRKHIWPLRDVIGGLVRGESSMFKEETRLYLQDVHDHVLFILESVDTHRERATDLMSVYLSTSANRTNRIVRVLTVITTIFMPLTLLTGVYGMNFHYMPELEWAYGYPLVLAFMAMLAAAMLYLFRKKNWL